MRQGTLFAAVALGAAAAGGALWWATLPTSEGKVGPIEVSPGVVLATAFMDADGRRHSLAEFAGKTIVLNFWATWCVPCREEMPAFARLQSKWAAKGVQFVGVANDDAGKVARFGRELAINYPLWTGEAASELSRRLGNPTGGLPHTVLLDAAGRVASVRVGPYTETDLDAKLQQLARNS